MGRKLTKEKYEKIKKDAKVSPMNFIITKYGYKQTTIRQIKNSQNWDDYRAKYILRKRVSEDKPKSMKADFSIMLLEPSRKWARLFTKAMGILVFALLAAIIIEAVIIFWLWRFNAVL